MTQHEVATKWRQNSEFKDVLATATQETPIVAPQKPKSIYELLGNHKYRGVAHPQVRVSSRSR